MHGRSKPERGTSGGTERKLVSERTDDSEPRRHVPFLFIVLPSVRPSVRLVQRTRMRPPATPSNRQGIDDVARVFFRPSSARSGRAPPPGATSPRT